MNLYNEILNADGFAYDFKILLNMSIYNSKTTGDIASSLAASGLFIIDTFNPGFIVVRNRISELKKIKIYDHNPLFYSTYVATAIRKYLMDNRDKVSKELEYKSFPFTFDNIMSSNVPDLLFNVTLTNTGFIVHM